MNNAERIALFALAAFGAEPKRISQAEQDGTVQFDTSDLVPVNAALGCIELTIEDGACAFDMSALNPGGACRPLLDGLPEEVQDKVLELKDRLDLAFQVPPIERRFIAKFVSRVRDVRLESWVVSWSAEHSGSLQMRMVFESEGTEITGDFDVQVNNLNITIWLPISIRDGGLLATGAPVVKASASINVENLHRKLESRQEVIEEIERLMAHVIGGIQSDLLVNDLVSLLMVNRKALPNEPYRFVRVSLVDGSAEFTWTRRLARVSLELIEAKPNPALERKPGSLVESTATLSLAIAYTSADYSSPFPLSGGGIRLEVLVADSLPFKVGYGVVLRREEFDKWGNPQGVKSSRVLTFEGEVPAPSGWHEEERILEFGRGGALVKCRLRRH